jgi:formate--tetrahydrofolate ligase
VFVGLTRDRNPLFGRDFGAAGAMAALLRDALQPNLVQTIEGTPAIVHGGPFANIAQGTNTLLATLTGLSLSPYVVTEAGFGFDLGGEKFLHLKCRQAGLSPAAVVIVVTVRALKYHGGQQLDDLKTENLEALERGLVNLQRHLHNAQQFGLQAVVAVNRFPTDTDTEVQHILEACTLWGVPAEPSEVWARGGAGAESLAKQVLRIAESNPAPFTPLYPLEAPFRDKLIALATKLYGANGIELSHEAEQDLRLAERLGLDKLPICVAKTQKSFSDDETLLGAPSGWTLNVRRIEIAAGAGFLVPVTGTLLRMPGLPSVPAAENIDLDADGNITGLF